MNNKNVRTVFTVSLNIVLVIAGILIIFTAGNKAFNFGKNIFDEQSIDSIGNGRTVEVQIPDNATASQVAGVLREKGLVKDQTICEYQIKLSEYKDKIKAGNYVLNTEMKPTDMLKVISGEE